MISSSRLRHDEAVAQSGLVPVPRGPTEVGLEPVGAPERRDQDAVPSEHRMKIIVTVKQVPDPDIPPTHFKVDEAARKVVQPSGVAPVMNGYDGNALEAALRLKEKHGGTVTVLTVGGAEARDTLKRAIAMGADSAVHVNDPALADADSATTATVLAAAIRKVGEYDLILAGRQASDTDAGQVPLGVAELLGLPSVAPVIAIEPSGSTLR